MSFNKREAIINMIDKLSEQDIESIFKLFIASGVTRQQCSTHASGECSINLDLLHDDIINVVYNTVIEKFSNVIYQAKIH